MKFCYNCGISVDGQQKYCKECGANLNEIPTENCQIPSSNIDRYKKTIKTMNIVSLCLMIPYLILACVIVFFADFYTLNDRMGYMVGLLWPILFELVLFFLVSYITKSDDHKKTITVHLVVSVIFLGALVLGGLMMLLLSYGMVVFPFASSILQAVIGYKMKKQITTI